MLIGAFTNPISRRLTEQSRFTFAEDDAASPAYIQDRQNPRRRDCVLPPNLPPDAAYTDYAIISRVIDPVTDRVGVVSAGIRKRGTFAAAEFLSHPEQLEGLTDRAPRDWRRVNMQAVLSVAVRNGKADRAQVIASYFW